MFRDDEISSRGFAGFLDLLGGGSSAERACAARISERGGPTDVGFLPETPHERMLCPDEPQIEQTIPLV
jgi:hypothetical protein